MESDRVNFYSAQDEYGWFSNFSRHKVFYKGHSWPTSEHAFQAMKFEGTEHEITVLRAKNPKQAAAIGRNRKLPLRPDWEEVKDQIMEEIVSAKFS